MNFTKVDRPQLVADLKHNVVEVSFIKADGSHRLMRCTLNKKYLSEAWVDNHNPNLISVWDIEANGWRSFHLDQIVSIQAVNTP